MALMYVDGAVRGPNDRTRQVRFLVDSGAKNTLYVILPQGEAHAPVIIGQPGDEALLGVVTLEILGLVLNPLTRELKPDADAACLSQGLGA